MKKKSVLIYGEYSGYGKSLVKGFKELGYQSDVLSFSGDGFKKINDGLKLKGNSKFRKMLSLIKLIPKILSYENILVVNPDFFRLKFLGPLILFLLKIKNKNIILLCCGDDVEFIKQGIEGKIVNWPYCDISLPSKDYFNKRQDIIINYLIASLSSKIIPVMYDYKKAWSYSKFSHKLTETIPLACDGEIKTIQENNNKIIIMHGINREGFKGSNVIKKALLNIKNKYNNEVEIIFPEKLPLTEYLEIMNNVDVAIDQTKGNSYGMNAIYSMLAGHIVLAPSNIYFKNDLNIQNSPIVSIENNENSIFVALEKILDERYKIKELKLKTQEYAIKIHSPKTIALKIDKYLL